MRRFTSALFLAGLAVLVAAVYQQMNLAVTPLAGDAINASAGQQVGAGNIVTAVVLAFRGFDTLLELTILFTAATVGGLVLGKPRADAPRDPDAGFILQGWYWRRPFLSRCWPGREPHSIITPSV